MGGGVNGINSPEGIFCGSNFLLGGRGIFPGRIFQGGGGGFSSMILKQSEIKVFLLMKLC